MYFTFSEKRKELGRGVVLSTEVTNSTAIHSISRMKAIDV